MMDGAALDKFRKVCGLLTSEHDGERATAARMASAILKQNGITWSAVSIGAAPAFDPFGSNSPLVNYWRMMLDDERAKNKRIASDNDKLKRQVKTLELKLAEQATGVPVAEQRKREKAEKKARKEERLQQQRREAAERAANPRADLPGDAELRERIAEALEQRRDLPDRTVEFLDSVKDQKQWTLRQREAIRKTLSWVFRARGD